MMWSTFGFPYVLILALFILKNHKYGSSEQKTIPMKTVFRIPRNWVAHQSIKQLKLHPLVS